MPLPDGDTPWPPRAIRAQLADVKVHSAWYSGNRDVIAGVYGRLADRDDLRPSRGLAAFWTRSRDLTQPDHRLHIPLAADICTTSADLLFAEPPTYDAAADAAGTATQDRLTQLDEETGLSNVLLEAAEVAAALGDVYLALDWQLDLAARPLVKVVHADAAVPEWTRGVLTAVTFHREVFGPTAGDRKVRLLERHEKGRIEIAVYEGSVDGLGNRFPLGDPSLPDDVRALADGLDAQSGKLTVAGLMTAFHVPNMRPNRRYRGSMLGRSDLQGIEDLLDGIDETWTSWMRDVRLGRARLVVPTGYLERQGRGAGAFFDTDREVFTPLNIPATTEHAPGITATQFAIRVDDHARTALELVKQAISIAGYSAQSFGLAGDVAVTATEVTSRERKSLITRAKKIRYWRTQISAFLEAMLALDQAIGTAPPGVEPGRPEVTFGDTVAEDPKDTATSLDLLNRAVAVSIDTKVRLAHPEWDDDAVTAEVALIKREQGMDVATPDAGMPAGFGADPFAAAP